MMETMMLVMFIGAVIGLLSLVIMYARHKLKKQETFMQTRMMIEFIIPEIEKMTNRTMENMMKVMSSEMVEMTKGMVKAQNSYDD